MNERDYSAELYKKMKAEQRRYRNWLATQPPEDILNHAYEYTVREDIVMATEEVELNPKQAKALLKSLAPLDDVFKEYNNRETKHMDIIRDCIESRADTVLKRELAREGR